MNLGEIAEAVSAQLLGDPTLRVDRLVHPADAAGVHDLAVALTEEARGALNGSLAQSAVVMAGGPAPPDRLLGVILADSERPTLAVLSALFDPGPARTGVVDGTAVIASDASIGPGVSVGPLAVIGPGCRIGAGAVVMAQATLGAEVTVGDGCLIHSGVRIGDRVVLGNRVIVHANAVVGADGFSFAPTPTGLRRVHSLGRVVIEDDVEIGAGSTIDRATLRATRIGRGTKIDNLVQVGHNVVIGEGCLICANVGISGSVRLGDRVVVGGGVGIADHVTIGSDARIAAGSGVATKVPAGVVVSGYPALPHERSLEQFLYLGRQKALHRKVDGLQARIDLLEKTAEAGKR